MFREEDRFSFSIGGVNEKKRSFKPKYCDMSSAVKLIDRFSRVIGVNLEKQQVESCCFLPFCILPVENVPGCDVAVFGKVTNPHPTQLSAEWVRCAVSMPGKPSFPIERANLKGNFDLFLIEALSHNQLIKKTPIGSENPSLCEESSDSRPMDAYFKRFRILAEKDEKDQITQLMIQTVSVFDSTIVLNENQWAITLVSTTTSSGQNVFGHAMLACEGVRKGLPFLEYVHLIQNSDQKEKTAHIERFPRPRPFETKNGPTWRRSKEAVENLFHAIEKKNIKPIPFSLSLHLYILPVLSHIPLLDIPARLSLAMYESIKKKKIQPSKQNCLNCVVELAKEAGIIFCDHNPLTTPLHKIAVVNQKPTYQIPDGLLPNQEEKQTIEKIKSCSVLLTPEHCSPGDFPDWINFIQRAEGKLKQLSSLAYPVGSSQ